MANRKIVRRGGASAAQAPVKAVATPKNGTRRQKVEEEDLEDLEDEVADEDEEEEEVAVPASRRARHVEVDDDDETADVADDEDYIDDDEEEDEPAPVVAKGKKAAPAPVSKKAAPAPVKKAAPAPVKPAAKQAAPAPVASIKKVDDVVANNVFAQLMETLETGQAVLLTRTGKDSWVVAKTDAMKASGHKLGNTEAWRIMANPEYLTWMAEWQEKDYDQKKAYAKKKKITWEEHKTPSIDVMRITQAVRAAEGIEKYKPEYRTREARAALRG